MMDGGTPTGVAVDAAAASDAALARLTAAVESVLFVAGGPVPARRLAEVTGASPEDVDRAVAVLHARLADSGLLVQAVAGGYQLGTRPEHADVVRRFLQTEHRERLSRGALEVLAIIAYRQPCTRGDIEQLRGARSDWHIERLLERQLIRAVGRREAPGRPVLFGTTDLFLRYFGLRDLRDLPPLGDRGVQALLDTLG
jgi:segregation and condensation protein B